MTQHRKLKNKQHEPLQKLGVISGAPVNIVIRIRLITSNARTLLD